MTFTAKQNIEDWRARYEVELQAMKIAMEYYAANGVRKRRPFKNA